MRTVARGMGIINTIYSYLLAPSSLVFIIYIQTVIYQAIHVQTMLHM